MSSETKPDSNTAGSRTPASPPGATPTAGLGSRGVLRKALSFPVFLGSLLLAAAYVSRLANLREATSASSSTPALFWMEGDTWWHIVIGQLILKTHAWPTHDLYSFTVHGSPWIAYEWLGDVVLALIWRAGGIHGLLILLTGLAWAILLLLYYYAHLDCRNSKAAFVATAAMLPLVSLSSTLRPQLLGYIFLIVTLIILKRFRRGDNRSVWLLPVIFLLWVNTHGTFVLGFGAIGLYWLSGLRETRWGGLYGKRWTPKQRTRLEFTGLLCLLASLITPYGTQLAAYPLGMTLFQPLNLQFIQEWEPLDLSQFYGKLFIAIVLLFWVLLLVRRPTLRLEDTALTLVGTAETFIHARFVLLFVPVFAPVLAQLIAPWLPKYDAAKDRPVMNFVLMSLIGLGMALSFPSRGKLEKDALHQMPVRAVRFLRAHTSLGPTFNDYDWGGYLILTSAPALQVFIDGRLDIYEYYGVMTDYLDIMHVHPDTWFLLKKYHIRSCLIRPGSALATLLAASPAWKEVYQDRVSVVFAKTGGHN